MDADAFYRIRVPTSLSSKSGSSGTKYASAAVPARLLQRAGFRERIVLHLGAGEHVTGVTYRADSGAATGSIMDDAIAVDSTAAGGEDPLTAEFSFTQSIAFEVAQENTAPRDTTAYPDAKPKKGGKNKAGSPQRQGARGGGAEGGSAKSKRQAALAEDEDDEDGEDIPPPEDDTYMGLPKRVWYIVLPFLVMMMMNGGDEPKEGEGGQRRKRGPPVAQRAT